MARPQEAWVKTRVEAWVDQITWMGSVGSVIQYCCWGTVLSSLQNFRLDRHGLPDRDRFYAGRYLTVDRISLHRFATVGDTNCVLNLDLDVG